MAEKLVLVSALETLNKGQQFTEWPLHVTILPWFGLPKDREQAFDNALTNRVYKVAPVFTVGGEVALFGPNKDVQVRKLRSIGTLASLHNLVLETVRGFDGTIDSPYIERNYEPHVTFRNEQGISEGQELKLATLQLIRGDTTGLRTVERNFYLGGKGNSS